MFFRQLLAKDATLSYFFGCGSCHVGVAVDPVLGDEQWFIDEAAKQDVKITHVIDTHVHADHYTGGRKLAELTGAAYCLHEANAGRVNAQTRAWPQSHPASPRENSCLPATPQRPPADARRSTGVCKKGNIRGGRPAPRPSHPKTECLQRPVFSRLAGLS